MYVATSQKAIKVTARRKPVIPKEYTFNFGRYEGSILSKFQIYTVNNKKLWMMLYYLLLFSLNFTFSQFWGRYISKNWNDKNCRRANLTTVNRYHWLIVIEIHIYKISCSTNGVIFPVCPTNYSNILILLWFLCTVV